MNLTLPNPFKRVVPFKDLSMKDRRLAVARDVLVQLKTEKLTVLKGNYCTPWNNGSCRVCAKGALMLGYLRKTEISEDKILQQVTEGEITNSSIMRQLSDCFEALQLNLIECAFEKDAKFVSARTHSKPAMQKAGQRAARYGQKFQNPTERLQAIMKNIIQNDGCFIP